MKEVFLKAVLLLLSCFSLISCAAVTAPNPYTGQAQVSDTAVGTGLGAVAGGLTGGLINGKEGAIIGAGVGALSGGFIGHHIDAENAELRQRLAGTGVQVVRTGSTIQLVMPADITFDFNQSAIKTDFYPTLDAIALVLKKYTETSIVISGYTDNIGGDGYNQALSEERAKSVGNYLSTQGTSVNRIFTQGFGKRYPIASNTTVTGRAQNRRVEITLRPLS